jgi:uncharacterized protein YycO
MRARVRQMLVGCGLVAGLLVAAPSAQAVATPSLDPGVLRLLVEYQPGSTNKSVTTAVMTAAKESGQTAPIVAAAFLAEARSHLVKQVGMTPMSSGSGDAPGGYRNARKVVVPCSWRQGDFFFSDASTAGVTYGHNGLFSQTCQTVEAVGGSTPVTAFNLGSHTVWTSSDAPARSRGPNNVSAAARAKAAVFALSQRGKAYNSSFASNRHVQSATYNCSQLVWAAWMTAANLDLDKDGGWGVYPIDLRDSPRASTLFNF